MILCTQGSPFGATLATAAEAATAAAAATTAAGEQTRDNQATLEEGGREKERERYIEGGGVGAGR